MTHKQDDELFTLWTRNEAVLSHLAYVAELEALTIKDYQEEIGMAKSTLAAWGQHYLLEEIVSGMREYFANGSQLKEVK